MLAALRRHWPEYLMEAWGLGLFMLSAAGFGALLEHPASPLNGALPDASLRRVLMGLLMALTALVIFHSRWGQRSGAHINPCVTLSFLRLGKIAPADACWYVVAQCLGGVLGVLIVAAFARAALADPHVQYVATVPGPAGAGVAFAAEAAISFAMLLSVLVTSNHPRLSRYTTWCAAALVMLWISVEAPLSGMSMNPARSLGSALPSGVWTAFWVYLLAPTLGMLAAAELYARWRGVSAVLCAKLHHHNDENCIFRCGFCRHAMEAAAKGDA